MPAVERSTLDAIAVGLIVLATDKTVVRWNRWMESASGLSAVVVVGKSLDEVFPDTDLAALRRGVDAAIDTGTSTLLTSALHPSLLPLMTSTGRSLLHDIGISPIGSGPDGACVVQIKDVTEQTRRERFLRARQNARYDALVESASDAILTVDTDGIVRHANSAAAKQFGSSLEGLIGSPARALFEDESTWYGIYAAVTSDAPPTRPTEVRIRRKDGTVRYSEAAAAQWHDGTRAFVTAILRDVTDRRETEIALRASEQESRASAMALASLNEVLEESSKALAAMDRRKDEFIATLAHELRNPLAPLRNGLQLLKLAKDDPGLLERTRHMMEHQLGQMVRLIDDLLDVSRISTDRLELSKEITSLEKVIRQAIETSGPLIDTQQHKLSITLTPQDVFIDADVVRLTQVFANLLNNAAKYTPRGGTIAIDARREPTGVAVSVTDNGIGIPGEMLTQIFEMFLQVDNSLERAQGGLGIGLSLVKRLVTLHGGTVEARSRGKGMGSTFTVRLPIAAQGPDARDAASGGGADSAAGARLRILLADDNEDSATSLSMLLGMSGHETKTARDGVEALEVAATFRPHLVLLDIGMPRLNGYETARRLRTMPGGESVVLAALSGWGQDEDRQRSSEAGFDAHFIKPANIADIERLIAGVRESVGRP